MVECCSVVLPAHTGAAQCFGFNYTVRQRRAEQEEAGLWSMDSRERERQSEVHWSLDLLLHVEVNGKEQALSSQLLPSLCVSF